MDVKTGKSCAHPGAPFVVALGNFDGVHVAHHALLLRAKRRADEYSVKQKTYSAAWLFDPPSSDFFQPGQAHLTTLNEKLSLFAACGLDYAFVADFSALRDLSPEDFIRCVLVEHAHAIHAVCGFHFNFGKGGAGDTQLLRSAFGHDAVDVIPPIYAPVHGIQTVVSSTAIRACLAKGDIRTANLLLGRPYSVCAPVEHGKHLGRTIGLPTINQNFPDSKCIPATGIYATICRINDALVYGVTNIGTRPTTDGLNVHINCETHLIDFCGDLYGQSVSVCFIERLRDERTFDGLDQLKQAIQNDLLTVKNLMKENEHNESSS